MPLGEPLPFLIDRKDFGRHDGLLMGDTSQECRSKGTNLSIFDLKTQQWKDLLRKGQNGFPSWSKDSRFIYFLRTTDVRGIYRIPISGGDEERIVDLKEFRNIGWYTNGWLGLDPTDAPLLLRDAGTDEIYALTLEQK